MDKLKEWIKNRRVAKGLNIRELAAYSLVTTAQISRIENDLSDLTINALVGLGYGLDFDLEDVLKVLDLSTDKVKHRKRKNSEALVPKISDAHAIWLLFRDEPQKAKHLMYEGFAEVKSASADNENAAHLQKLAAFEEVAASLQVETNRFTPLSFPPIRPEYLNQIYRNEGVITLNDLGSVLTQRRLELDISQRELARQTDMSNSVISRFESGDLGRVSFEYIIRIDEILEMRGSLLEFAWETGEYQSGVSLLKYLNEKDWAKKKQHYHEWDQSAKAWADTFVATCRWQHAVSQSHAWWDSVQREIFFYKK